VEVDDEIETMVAKFANEARRLARKGNPIQASQVRGQGVSLKDDHFVDPSLCPQETRCRRFDQPGEMSLGVCGPNTPRRRECSYDIANRAEPQHGNSSRHRWLAEGIAARERSTRNLIRNGDRAPRE
jgi:hypothetical protein